MKQVYKIIALCSLAAAAPLVVAVGWLALWRAEGAGGIAVALFAVAVSIICAVSAAIYSAGGLAAAVESIGRWTSRLRAGDINAEPATVPPGILSKVVSDISEAAQILNSRDSTTGEASRQNLEMLRGEIRRSERLAKRIEAVGAALDDREGASGLVAAWFDMECSETGKRCELRAGDTPLPGEGFAIVLYAAASAALASGDRFLVKLAADGFEITFESLEPVGLSATCSLARRFGLDLATERTLSRQTIRCIAMPAS